MTRKKMDTSIILSFLLIIIAIVYLLFSFLRTIQFDSLNFDGMKVCSTIFISIIMQAFPFMLIGVLVASALHVFVPEDFIVRVFPRKYGLGFLTAMLGGILFPICECAIVPVMTGLVKKGVALPIALTFMFSAPIINPIVIVSTLYAFPGQPEIAFMRVIFGLTIAFVIGIILLFTGMGKNALICNEYEDGTFETCTCSCCGHEHHHHHPHVKGNREGSFKEKLAILFLHAGEEFFGVGRYLVLGAFITSLVQTVIPRTVFVNLLSQNGLSLLVMMVAAFLFSACSTSDAFIARSFVNKFPMSSVMGFMVFGPMMDIKNVLMLMGSFKKKFVFALAILVFAVNFIMLYFIQYISL